MTSQLNLVIDDRPGSLIRVLGLAERRGCNLISVRAIPAGKDIIFLNLSVRTQRSIDLLQRQIQKLIDVHSVEVM